MSNNQDCVLLVEDDPNDIVFVQRAYHKAKLINPLFIVRDGEEAVAYLDGTAKYADRMAYPLPMLILLDLKLPRKSGLEVLEWIRQQPILRRIPIVVLTSSRDSADINHAYELGANTYIAKPVQFEGLLDLVKTLDLYWRLLSEKPNLTG